MLRYLLSLILILTCSQAIASMYIRVSLYGKEMGVKESDFKSVNKAMGQLVSDYKLKKFEIINTGTEGGFTACLEPHLQVDGNDVWKLMSSVAVDTRETIYSVELTRCCAEVCFNSK